mmetsp:Transcript_137030/g.249137  ORF Transcript_137030/g.249137 Transcript_137030/m.249137 type:complete len:275 (+) Transcript_137030:3952-4776(+)
MTKLCVNPKSKDGGKPGSSGGGAPNPEQPCRLGLRPLNDKRGTADMPGCCLMGVTGLWPPPGINEGTGGSTATAGAAAGCVSAFKAMRDPGFWRALPPGLLASELLSASLAGPAAATVASTDLSFFSATGGMITGPACMRSGPGPCALPKESGRALPLVPLNVVCVVAVELTASWGRSEAGGPPPVLANWIGALAPVEPAPACPTAALLSVASPLAASVPAVAAPGACAPIGRVGTTGGGRRGGSAVPAPAPMLTASCSEIGLRNSWPTCPAPC